MLQILELFIKQVAAEAVKIQMTKKRFWSTTHRSDMRKIRLKGYKALRSRNCKSINVYFSRREEEVSERRIIGSQTLILGTNWWPATLLIMPEDSLWESWSWNVRNCHSCHGGQSMSGLWGESLCHHIGNPNNTGWGSKRESWLFPITKVSSRVYPSGYLPHESFVFFTML